MIVRNFSGFAVFKARNTEEINCNILSFTSNLATSLPSLISDLVFPMLKRYFELKSMSEKRFERLKIHFRKIICIQRILGTHFNIQNFSSMNSKM